MNKAKLSKLWDSLHSSYWFLPTIILVIAIALAFIVLAIDRAGFYGPLEKWGWIYTGGSDGARAVLSAIAGSIITVATTAFSITIVALQLASSNFGPRLLRNFMQDMGNQIVLGTFIGTFAYCLLLLRTIRGDGDDYSRFVPHLSVTVGIVFAFASIGVLIYFIHHASTIIQVSTIIADVSTDLDSAIDRLFPEKLGLSPSKSYSQVAQIPIDFKSQACQIQANGSGYLQSIDHEKLLQIASQHKLLLHLKYRPGKFVVNGSELVLVYPRTRVNRKLIKQIDDTFILGKERTEQQDIEFPIAQLVEIALRAISPGINDPFTAIRCIDRLSDGLSRLAQREFPSPYRYDDDGNLRVIAEPFTFTGLIDLAFNQLRQYGKSDVAVTIRLLDAIATIANYVHDQQGREVLLHHAEKIWRDSHRAISEQLDLKDIEERYEVVVETLELSENEKRNS